MSTRRARPPFTRSPPLRYIPRLAWRGIISTPKQPHLIPDIFSPQISNPRVTPPPVPPLKPPPGPERSRPSQDGAPVPTSSPPGSDITPLPVNVDVIIAASHGRKRGSPKLYHPTSKSPSDYQASDGKSRGLVRRPLVLRLASGSPPSSVWLVRRSACVLSHAGRMSCAAFPDWRGRD